MRVCIYPQKQTEEMEDYYQQTCHPCTALVLKFS